jgi:hypothetical protein
MPRLTLTPFDLNNLSLGMVIVNYTTGDRFEVVKIDDLIITLKSQPSNDMTVKSIYQIKPLDWWVFSAG